uniref:Portal protein n=1 Tax=viral metagenome TaxID=1070528 RepID=A0A6M3INH1_9ZZZZ
MSTDYSENKTDDSAKKKTSLLNWEEQMCKQIEDEWTKGQTYVSDLNDLFDDLYAMLRGERPTKNYDWQSNVVINKVFQVVWTSVPYICQKIFGATPVIGVKSYDKKGAWQREEILEFWNTMQASPEAKHTPYFLIVVMLTLRAILNGVGIMKKSWHQKLESEENTTQIAVPMEMDEEGNETRVEPHEVTENITTPIEDWPENTIINNRDIVFDWMLKPGQSIRHGRFVTHREMVDLASLYDAGIYMNLDKIDPNADTTSSELRQDHSDLNSRDGQDTPPGSDIYADVEIKERVGNVPVKMTKDGYVPVFDKEEIYGAEDVEMVNMIVTEAICGTGEKKYVLIRFEENPYGCINYVDTHLFFDPERFQSMGLVEPMKDLQTCVNDNINAMFDEIWQNLMPPVVVNKFALWDWDTMQYAPQQRWLVGGEPSKSIYFKEPSNITRDAWNKHSLLDSEIQLMTVTNSMQGMGREKTATTNVMNAQMTAGKLDFLVKMIETTGLIPSSQMDVKFAKMFAHPKTFKSILGEDFQFSDYEEVFKYIPAASSVKGENQKETEIQQDIQMIGLLTNMQNPNAAKVVNMFLANILRNRNSPKAAALLDEDFYEPQSDAGNMSMMQKMLGGQIPQNQEGLPMSGQEKSMRRLTYEPRSIY